MKYALLILFLSSALQAQTFTASPNQSHIVSCTAQRHTLTLSSNQTYRLYDTSVSQVRVHKCETIQINGLHFLTITYSGLIQDSQGTSAVLIDETALISNRQIRTVRSEVVDQSALQRGAIAQPGFTLGLIKKWGVSQTDPSLIMLEMTITEKGKTTQPYYLKYNPRVTWFENIFTKN